MMQKQGVLGKKSSPVDLLLLPMFNAATTAVLSREWNHFRLLLDGRSYEKPKPPLQWQGQSDVRGRKNGKKRDSTSEASQEATTAAAVNPCNTSSRSLRSPCKDASGDISTSFASYSSASIVASATTSSSSSSSSVGGSFPGMHLRRLSGCYECHVMVDPINGPSRDPSMRVSICTCPHCGEIFVRPESLELHQAVRHAVSELGPEDTSRNIIEIIFQSSWLKNQTPVCKIDRILKVHNTPKAIARFEDYRDSIKTKADNKVARKHPRCVADGNELLRFHCTTLACSLGVNGSTSLCQSTERCNVCSIIRDGFKLDEVGKIQTMATSGRAHDMARVSSSDEEKRAMLVCRVIAGRVNKSQDAVDEFDSVAGSAGTYSSIDELFVFSPKAILPCFVVIYTGF
ncbi:hypothetical protein OPV22_013822 [Ensete ventricosum]|uniref:C2H2-type domain-containing protein n=1 Tax=Ensete ventricosum TaxID=4639 RepID=A0AAV8R5R6_ENSVE|nr:hypothetical protein OPV22_013822 [Ensete ventricosum]